MSPALHTPHLTPLAAVPLISTPPPAVNPMARLSAVVRAFATDLLCATDTRIVKIACENGAGWGVEVEVFAPNPELTVSLRGGSKAILERSRYRLHFDVDLQLVALEPVEE
jgi:hypothetical protein